MKQDLPFQAPLRHMLAKAAPKIPEGTDWLYEPKWDGFRCLLFFDGESVYLQSRDQKPLNRHFPELETQMSSLLTEPVILDGEIIIATGQGLDFEALQIRIHPAASRVQMLAQQTPASFVAFDCLAFRAEDLRSQPFSQRRKTAVKVVTPLGPPFLLTPTTEDPTTAQDWFNRFEGAGLDGVIAKTQSGSYQPGQRGWLKIKHLRSLDCVVGGFRWNRGEEGRSVGSLLLGLYDADGVLHFVGHTSSFKAAEREELARQLQQIATEDVDASFGHGRTPGEPSRWTGDRDMSWVRLQPDLVCEVTYDYLQGNRLRHAGTFQRWRPDKLPVDCGFDQIEVTPPFELEEIFQAG